MEIVKKCHPLKVRDPGGNQKKKTQQDAGTSLVLSVIAGLQDDPKDSQHLVLMSLGSLFPQ